MSFHPFSKVMLTAFLNPFSLYLWNFPTFVCSTNIWTFTTKLKNSLPARCAPPCFTLHQSWGLLRRWIPGSIRLRFFVVSLFHGLLMGSRPSFRIQRHAVLLMIIRSSGNRFTADSPTTVWLVHSPLDCHEAESICWSLGGKERFKFAQQVINAVLTQCCHAGKKETLEEFGVLLLLSRSQGHGSESIDHYGASELMESGAIASPWKKRGERSQG